MLVALFSERESHAVYFLQLQDMTRLDAVNFISHGIAKAPGRPGARPTTAEKSGDGSGRRQRRGRRERAGGEAQPPQPGRAVHPIAST